MLRASTQFSRMLFDRLRDDPLDTMQASERERQRRLSKRKGRRVDATHPPTALRIAMIQQRPALPARIWLSDAEESQLDAELASLEPEIQRRLVSHYLVGIHG